MKQNYFKLMTLLMVIAVIIGACEKNEDSEPNENSNDLIHEYSGSGSAGDLITFTIDQTKNRYTIHNETTGVDEHGNYTILSDNNLSGVYKINTGSSNYYAIELNEKIIAANFPTGNPDNNISFGVSSSIDNTGNTGNIFGDYAYIIMDNNGIMNDPLIKEWGILNVKGNHTWIKKGYATNTGNGSIPEMSPEEYTGSLPITSGDETGSWAVNGVNKERIDVTVNGIPGNLAGFVYASYNEAAFLLDLGTGNGFLIGVKITDLSSFNTIAGNYKYINIWGNNGLGAGNFSINNNGQVNWTHQGSAGPSNGSFQLTQCSNVFKNIYYCDDVDLGGGYYEQLYCVISGDIILHFGFDNSNGNFAQYGIGARF